MRTAIVTLGLVALVSAGIAARQPQERRHSLLPPHKPRLSVDFGAKRALMRLPIRPTPCVQTTRKHHHEVMTPAAGFVEMPFYQSHRLRSPQPAPCAAR